MRSLYKISLAILAVGFLVVAGSAFAQDMAKPTFTITGDAGTAFGSYSFDKTTAVANSAATTKAFSEYVTTWESNVRLTWATPEFQAIVRYRYRGSNEGSGLSGNAAVNAGAQLQSGQAQASSANDVYGESWWIPGGGAFKLGVGKFQGQAWSQPLAGTYIMINPIEIAAGASEYWMNWTGIAGLDAEYNLGTMQIGVALSSQCKPSCNNAQSNNTTARTEVNTSSMVPHFVGTFGDITVRAQLPSATGTGQSSSSTKTITVQGSGLQAGVKWAGPGGLAVAADISNFTDKKDTTFLAQAKDRARSGTALRLDVPAGPGSVTVGYFTQDDNPGFDAHTYTSTITTLRFNMPATFGWIIPEFRTATAGGAVTPASGTKKADATNSEFRLMLQGRF